MKTFEPITLRLAAKKYMGGTVTLPSIFGWMSRGIFKPSSYEPPPVGPGKGCRLDLADMATLIMIHRMFNLGVKFESLRASSQDMDSSRVFFEWESDEKQPLVIRYTDGREVKVDRTKWVQTVSATDIGNNREIQKFLDRFNFEVMVCICKRRIPRLHQRSITTHEITFFHATDNLRADFLSRLDATADYDSVSFISAKSCLRQVHQ